MHSGMETVLEKRKALSAYLPAAMLAACAALGVYYALAARIPLEDDSINHFLLSKWMLNHNWIVVHIWARPLITLAYFPAAQAGFFWCRLTSLAICLAGAWYAYRLAKELRLKYAFFAIPLVFFQPYFFQLSTDLLTEPLFALLLICAVRNYARGRFPWAALQFSAMTATRPEGFFFVALFGLILLVGALRGKMGRPGAALKKLVLAALLLASVPLVWNIAGGIIYARMDPANGFDPLWLPHHNPWDASRFKYGSDGLLHYPFWMGEIAGPAALPLMALGFVAFFKRDRLWFVPALILFFLVLHTLMRTTGYFSSGGYARYFASLAPLMGLTALAGLDMFIGSALWIGLAFLVYCGVYIGVVPWLRELPVFNEFYTQIPGLTVSEAIVRYKYTSSLMVLAPALIVAWIIFDARLFRRQKQNPVAKRALATALIVICLAAQCLFCLLCVKPATESRGYAFIGEFADWLKAQHPALFADLGSQGPRKTEAKLMFSRYYLHMEQGWDPFDATRFGLSNFSDWDSLPPGSIIAWDSHFEPTENHVTREELDSRPNLIHGPTFNGDYGPTWTRCTLRVYEVAAGNPAAP